MFSFFRPSSIIYAKFFFTSEKFRPLENNMFIIKSVYYMCLLHV